MYSSKVLCKLNKELKCNSVLSWENVIFFLKDLNSDFFLKGKTLFVKQMIVSQLH